LGIPRLTPAGLIRQLQTLRVTREPDAKRRQDYVRRFLWMFAKQLVHTYGPLDEDGASGERASSVDRSRSRMAVFPI
jgi:hypothetical protein